MIKCVLSVLMASLFEISHLLMVISSLFILLIRLSVCHSERYVVRLSSNKMKPEVKDALDMSLICRMKSSSQEIER